MDKLFVIDGQAREQAAESGTVKMTDEVSKEVRRVYWSLSALRASPADYRRLLADIAMKVNGD